jgi:hypothetical protein
VLQRINGAVFPDPLRIMSNIQALDRQARQHADLGFRVPALIATRAGEAGLRTPDGSVWRLMTLIEDAVGLTRIEIPSRPARSAGSWVASIPCSNRCPPRRWASPYPDFTTRRPISRAFCRSWRGSRGARTTRSVETCVRFVIDRQALARRLADARDRGEIPAARHPWRPQARQHPLRPRQRARTRPDRPRHPATRPHPARHRRLSALLLQPQRRVRDGRTRVSFDLAIAEPILHAYAEQTRAWLSPEEIALIPEAIRLMPFELGLRFLTDHLEGDRYFKVAEPGENLRKAGIQFALVTDIEGKAEDIKAMVIRCFQTP